MAKDGVVTRLRRSLAEFLNPDDETPLPRRATARPRMASLGPFNNDFEQRLRSLLERAGGGALLAGRVNVIGLQKAKERLGPAWERVAERADRIARNTIERHLGEGDIYTRANNTTYVMVFARLSPEQAKVKCVMIGDEIAKVLFGESGGDLLEVKTAVMRVDGKLALENVSLTDQLFSSISSDNDLEFVLGDILPAKPAAQPSSGGDLLAGLRFAYRPIWDQARNVISTYICVAQVPTSDVGSAVSEAELALAGDAEALARLDAAVRQRVLDDLDQLIRENRRLLLTLPIHFETIGSVARRREYLAEIGKRAAGDAGKLLVIEITGVPEGVPQSRLVDLISPLRPLCRGVMLRVRLETAEFAQFKGCGAVAVGCDIGAHPGPEFALMQQMNRFNRAAGSAAMATYLHGAHSLSQVAASIGAGFNYIDGDAVAKLIDHPRHVANFQLTDLYRPLIKA